MGVFNPRAIDRLRAQPRLPNCPEQEALEVSHQHAALQCEQKHQTIDETA